MMFWVPKQYCNVWDEFYLSCDDDTLITLDSRLDLLLERGNQCRRPVTAHLEDGIFELRAKNARMLFCFGPEKKIIFLHGIIKKTSRVSPKDISTAKQHRKRIQENEVDVNEIENP
ncbi:MAG: type II toxin-antitoxin system RelE/ParE family toxin [Nitrospinae bacterium]|nr:type II toxin-antitoxin system RelE/ParE family toxin [Nitrospinota bacterium]